MAVAVCFNRAEEWTELNYKQHLCSVWFYKPTGSEVLGPPRGRHLLHCQLSQEKRRKRRGKQECQMRTNKACSVSPMHKKACLSYKFNKHQTSVRAAILSNSFNVTAHLMAVNPVLPVRTEVMPMMPGVLRVIAYGESLYQSASGCLVCQFWTRPLQTCHTVSFHCH